MDELPEEKSDEASDAELPPEVPELGCGFDEPLLPADVPDEGLADPELRLEELLLDDLALEELSPDELLLIDDEELEEIFPGEELDEEPCTSELELLELTGGLRLLDEEFEEACGERLLDDDTRTTLLEEEPLDGITAELELLGNTPVLDEFPELCGGGTFDEELLDDTSDDDELVCEDETPDIDEYDVLLDPDDGTLDDGILDDGSGIIEALVLMRLKATL